MEDCPSACEDARKHYAQGRDQRDRSAALAEEVCQHSSWVHPSAMHPRERLERKNGLGRVAGFALRSGFCAAIAHRVVHIPGSTLLGRRTDFGIFDLAVFRPFEQAIF